MVELYAMKINKMIDGLISGQLATAVTRRDHTRSQNFYNSRTVQKVSMAEILMRYLLCTKLNIRNTDLSFLRNEYGKPILRNVKDLHFNCSHSHQWVACAIDNQPIGVDIEMVRKIDYRSIAQRFFSESEYDDILKKNYPQRISYFYDIWTLKESYVKYVGKGLHIPLNSFSIYIKNDDIKVKSKNEIQDCRFKQYEIDKDYRMALCTTANAFSGGVIIKKVEKVSDEFLNRYV